MSFTVCTPGPKTVPEICVTTSPDACLKSDKCLKTCPDTCLKTSSDTCLKTVSVTCPKTCPDVFPKTCSDVFPKTCPDVFPKTCSDVFPKTCPDVFPKTCLDTCSVTCPKPRSKASQTISRHCGTKVVCAPKAHSVYGCGSGGSTRISTCAYRPISCSPCLPYKIGSCHSVFGARIMAGGCYDKDHDLLQKSEKATMQNLNDRLACYLEKVHSLEAANANLERLIREYYEKKGPICQRDYSCYLDTIHCLQEKIRDATIMNANIVLQIDNAKLAADDFKIKFDHESAMRQCVEADIANLRCILDKTYLSKADLEAQICHMQEELAFINKTHQEDVAALICQLSKTVSVEVDAAPQQDLNKILEEIRCHYENIIDQHRKKQECWFREKTEELCKDVACSTECMETSRSEIAELRRTLQCLEIELQSQISKKGALQCSLTETEARYCILLADFQNQINVLEAELCQVRNGIEQQGRDYDVLLDIKSRLEKEIATYRCLLENQENKNQGQGGLCTSTNMCMTPVETVMQCN